MSRCFLGLCIVLAMICVALPRAVHAQVFADHLLINEVGYDPADETGTRSEFIEILNPTGAAVPLNEGATPGARSMPAYFLSDAPADYMRVPTGFVALSTTTQSVWMFPLNSSLGAHQLVVVCADSDAFLAEFFANSIAIFRALPGQPLLFEMTQDGASDGIPDMIPAHSGTARSLDLANDNDNVILYRWDGQSDLVRDVDIISYRASGTPTVVNKTGLSIDGPDADTTPSTYLADAARSTGLLRATTANNDSLQRAHALETSEGTGGNGLTGHDETDEDWSMSLVSRAFGPGLLSLSALDDSGRDTLSFLQAIAVTSADGSAGAGVDYGADGTITELYATSVDVDGNRAIDSFFFALRGEFFGEPDAGGRTVGLLLDVNPAVAYAADNSLGYRRLVTSGDALADTTGALDTTITRAGFAIGTGLTLSGFDAFVGANAPFTAGTGDDTYGLRTFGVSSLAGTSTSLFTETSLCSFDGDVGSFARAPGAGATGTDLFETVIPFSSLGGAAPPYVAIVAIATAGTGTDASSVTIPEGATTSSSVPYLLSRALCFRASTQSLVEYYVDADGDGFGSSTRSTYCGPPIAGLAERGGDCDDTDMARHPTVTELCNSIDDDCDGMTDEGAFRAWYVDADGDGYGVLGSSMMSCTMPAGHADNSADCNDTRDDIHPMADEVCNGADEDCDGRSDETFTTLGSTCQVGAGICARNGRTLCAANGMGTRCDGVPGMGSDELCGNAVDEDCDGSTDEGFEVGGTCSAGMGMCSTSGTIVCTPDRTGVVCDASSSMGGAERCGNGVDDDCDGSIDEGFGIDEPCTIGIGACAMQGVRVCSENRLGSVCAGSMGTARLEICNNADDDCDGMTDEGGAAELCGGDVNGTSCVASGGTGFCGCTAETDCAGTPGTTCDMQTGRCITGCSLTGSANACPSVREVCYGTSGTFGACTLPCSRETDCLASLSRRICAGETMDAPGHCVECESDGDCAGRSDHLTHCATSSGTCTECVAGQPGGVCTANGNGGVCLASARCGCLGDSDCAGTTCDLRTNTCAGRGGDAGVGIDAGTVARDGAVSTSDAGLRDASHADVGAEGGGSDGGCGCRAVGGPSSGTRPTFLGGLVLAALLVTRRRRR